MTITSFAKRFCDARPGEFGGLDMSGRSNTAELQQRLSFTVSYVPYAEVAKELPPKRRQVIRIPPELLVKALSRSREDALEVRRWRAAAKKGDKRARGQLMETRIEDASTQTTPAVVQHVKDWVGVGGGDATGLGKVFVATGRRRHTEDLGKRLGGLRRIGAESSSREIPCWWAHGDDAGWNISGGALLEEVLETAHTAGESPSTNRAILDAYMAYQGPCILVGSIGVFGESLDMQDTDVIAVTLPPYTPGELDQLEGRGARIGQSRPLLVVFFLGEGTIHERIAGILIDKLPAVEELTGGGALDGLLDSLKGLDDRAAVLASLANIFDEEE